MQNESALLNPDFAYIYRICKKCSTKAFKTGSGKVFLAECNANIWLEKSETVVLWYKIGYEQVYVVLRKRTSNPERLCYVVDNSLVVHRRY